MLAKKDIETEAIKVSLKYKPVIEKWKRTGFKNAEVMADSIDVNEVSKANIKRE